MWHPGWREALWKRADQQWDMVIVGGGITGAGVFLEAARAGLRVVLVEQNDFASGTSSRSSKLVHGGLRYLAQYQFGLTLESVRERDRLLADAPGLVRPQSFIAPLYEGDKPGYWALRVGLWIYDWMAALRSSFAATRERLGMLVPGLRQRGLVNGLGFRDARTDDARLVFRVLQEAGRNATADIAAVNYAAMRGLLLQNDRVCGIEVVDQVSGNQYSLSAKIVVNASGAWADQVCAEGEELRPLRGSHLIFPQHVLPIGQAISRNHHQDPRTVFMYPWEGAVLVGTTDLDHRESLDRPPVMTRDEAQYLVDWVNHMFPGRGITLEDAISSYSGVRPVVSGGADKPSDESRESAIWTRPGMVTVTGGKLTTFRKMAEQVMKLAEESVTMALRDQQPLFLSEKMTDHSSATRLGSMMTQRLIGRYGPVVLEWITQADEEALQPLAGTIYLKAELTWAAQEAGIEQLGDLLLRRTRLGLLLPDGGAKQMPYIRAKVQALLGWDDSTWETEQQRYLSQWAEQHTPVPAK